MDAEEIEKVFQELNIEIDSVYTVHLELSALTAECFVIKKEEDFCVVFNVWEETNTMGVRTILNDEEDVHGLLWPKNGIEYMSTAYPYIYRIEDDNLPTTELRKQLCKMKTDGWF